LKSRVPHYSWTYIIRPTAATRELLQDPEKCRAGLSVSLYFAILYSITAMLLHLTDQEPVMEPFLPIEKKRYYFWQTFFTVPWGIAEWLMAGCALHIFNRRYNRQIGEILGPIAFANILPWVFTAWVPETFVVPTCKRVPWPAWVDAGRIILAIIWSFILMIKVAKVVYDISWSRACISALISLSIMGMMYMLFIR
jgi:hypothetical protein